MQIVTGRDTAFIYQAAIRYSCKQGIFIGSQRAHFHFKGKFGNAASCAARHDIVRIDNRHRTELVFIHIFNDGGYNIPAVGRWSDRCRGWRYKGHQIFKGNRDFVGRVLVIFLQYGNLTEKPAGKRIGVAGTGKGIKFPRYLNFRAGKQHSDIVFDEIGIDGHGDNAAFRIVMRSGDNGGFNVFFLVFRIIQDNTLLVSILGNLVHGPFDIAVEREPIVNIAQLGFTADINGNMDVLVHLKLCAGVDHLLNGIADCGVDIVLQLGSSSERIGRSVLYGREKGQF